MTRKTKQREAVLEALKGTNHHPTASWIYEQVRKKIPHISLGTVYRDLKLLAQKGEISELGLAGTLSRFDGNASNHYHFRCLKCGRIFDIDEPVDLEIDKRVAQKTGFEVCYHCLEFRGLCQDCQSRTPLSYKNSISQDIAKNKLIKK